MAPLATVEQLRIPLRMPNLDADDPYALMMLEQASTAVREYARQPKWVLVATAVDDVVAPQVARDVTLWVALRAYTNPLNLERRTAGPVSQVFRDSGIFGIDLTDGERNRLDPYVAGKKRGGLWVQPIYAGAAEGMLTVPSDMTVRGLPPGDPFYIADTGQFPYGYDSEGPAPVPYDGVTGV